jgi:hypothetical protein
MRTYFFGDIHGNGYALERCLAHLDEVKPDQVYCLVDFGWAGCRLGIAPCAVCARLMSPPWPVITICC